MDRPTVFLSSTIYDFRDLRSALKDYLELRGCTVYASDYNDFAKDLDRHSYDACLDTIAQADLFVLLIGSRVGGLMDSSTGKSITRAEYERAYELAQQGRMQIVAFVRDEVWTYRETMKELARFLSQGDAAQREVDVAKAPSKFMSDAENIISFIELVSRNAETGAAVRGEQAFPIANWLHRFSTFPEIRAVLDPLIMSGQNMPQAAARKALQLRLMTLLHGVLIKGSDGAVMPIPKIRALVERIGLKVADIGRSVDLDPTTWTDLVILTTYVLPIRADASPLVPYLNDPVLLQYDPQTGTFSETAEHRMLDELLREITGLNLALASFDAVAMMQGKNANRPPVQVQAEHVANALHILLRWGRVASFALALARAMDGRPLLEPDKLPVGPFVDQEEKLAKERLSMDDVRALISSSK